MSETTRSTTMNSLAEEAYGKLLFQRDNAADYALQLEADVRSNKITRAVIDAKIKDVLDYLGYVPERVAKP